MVHTSAAIQSRIIQALNNHAPKTPTNIRAIKREPDRNRMDPEAVTVQHKPEKTNTLSAAALHFDDNNQRGFKNKSSPMNR